MAKRTGPRNRSRRDRGGLVPVSDRFFRRPGSRPGPASVRSARGPGLTPASRTDGCSRPSPPRALTQRGGMAGSRLDGRGISLERPRRANRFTHCGRPSRQQADPVGSARRLSRTLFPRIRRPSPSAARRPSSRPALRPAVTGRLWRLGSDAASGRGTFSPRCAAPRAATLTRIVSSALLVAHEFRVARGARPLAARSVALRRIR